MKTKKWTKLNVFAVVFFTACVTLSFSPDLVYADDFGRIVHHIEASYHVHRNYRFLMGFAGIAVKFWHVGGVKSMKIAIFEDQHLDGTDTTRSWMKSLPVRVSPAGNPWCAAFPGEAASMFTSMLSRPAKT